MHETSGDEEFFDALGDEVQMEIFKAKASQQPIPDTTVSRPTCDKSVDSYHKQSINGLTRTRTPKLLSFDDKEFSLAITEKEQKDLKDATRNLHQILDRLDDTTHNMSSEFHGSGTIKLKHRVGSKEVETDSTASQIKNTVPKPIRNRLNNLHLLQTPKITSSKSDDTVEKTHNLSPRSAKSVGFSKDFTKNPLEVIANASSKKSFFSKVGQKRSSAQPEFTREIVKQNNRNMSNFDKLICLQYIEDGKKGDSTPNSKRAKNSAATWIVKFSPNNKLLATGGNDGILRIFNISIMNENFNQDASEGDLEIIDPNFINLAGHKSDIIDISWYKDSNLLLTSGMDKLVILWDVALKSPVKLFEHSDIVPCVAFHPLVDEYFATGCFDKMIRIWSINETKVVDWVQTNDLITALAFSPDKTLLLVGYFKGTIKMYRIDQGKLKFTMEITCKNAFSWGKINKVGKKVTGIVFTENYEFLVTTNDSRMRLINLKTLETKVKYKGHVSGKYHIQPSYNFEKELILSGSEDEKVYVWNKVSDYIPQINPLYLGQKSNRNTSYEHFKPFPKANATCAVWMPFPTLQKYKEKMLSVWKDLYVDTLIVLFSSDARIKVLGNLIELEGQKK